MSDLDTFDRAILALLQNDNHTPLRVIAEQVHLSTAAVQRRIRSLQDRGIIAANIAVVAPDRVGKVITILVEVQAERTHLDTLDALRAHLSGPEIQQCYYVTGDADFVLVMNVADMSEYDAVCRRLFYENKDIKWFRTMVVMDRVKVGLSVPV